MSLPKKLSPHNQHQAAAVLGGTLAIITELVNFCWTIFRWGLLLAAMLAVLIGGFLYVRLDDEIRRHVSGMMSEHFHGLDVEVGRARFEAGRGVTIYDVRFAQRDRAAEPMLTIDELFIAFDSRLEELLAGNLQIDQVVIRRPHVHLIRQSSGTWNLQSMLPLPKFSDQSSVVLIEDASLKLEDLSRVTSVPLVMRDINVQLTPLDPNGLTQAMVKPSAYLPARPSGGRYFAVRGTTSSSQARQITVEGTVGSDNGLLDLTASVAGLELSPELLAALPLPIASGEVQLYGRVDMSARMVRSPVAGSPLTWAADVQLERGRLEHSSLPRSLTELAIKAHLDHQHLKIESLTAKCGTADVAIACEKTGWAANAPIGLVGRVAGLSLDSRLRAVLPASMHAFWYRFEPSGKIDAQWQLIFDGKQWRPQLTATCLNVSVTDNLKFPYRLQQTTGTVAVVPAGAGSVSLQVDLQAVAQGRPISLSAEMAFAISGVLAGSGSRTMAGNSARPTGGVGWIDIQGTDIPIHEQLLAALPGSSQPFARSLHPEGKFDFHWRGERRDLRSRRYDTALDLTFNNCSIQSERFPYPLQNVSGLVTERNRQWTIHELVSRGRHGTTMVTCRGQCQPQGDVRHLTLVIEGSNVPLDDSLKQALTPETQRLWTSVRPLGSIDVVANVEHVLGAEKPVVEVALRPHERSLSIEPVFFPYRFEQLDGQMIVSSGRVELRNVRAVHGRATFASEGMWQKTPDGGWQFVLSDLNVDRLTAHRDLLAAMPLGLQKAFENLQPKGSFNIYGSTLQFIKAPSAPRISFGWDVQLDCHQASLGENARLENIMGGIRLVGLNDGQQFYTSGDMSIDSLVWKDMQLTNVCGPLWIDRSVCLLGSPATSKQGQPPSRVTADAYGGSMTADIQLQHDGHLRYQADLDLREADLGRFAAERFGGPNDLSGTVSGKLSLAGTGRSTHALSGEGELHVVDANIYRLPVLVALLKVLRNRTPDTTAFDRCDMNFAVQGEHIQFRQLNLLGNAVSLYGRGETNFDKELKLEFYSLVGPTDLDVPILKTLVGQASQQILQLKVDGTMDEPQIHREAFPAVNQVLQQIQAEFQGSGAGPETADRQRMKQPR